MPPYEWGRVFDSLKDHGFLEVRGEQKLRSEEVYLEMVVETEFQPLGNLKKMLGVFAGDPEALVDIGNKAWELGLVDLNRAKYLSLAIAAYKAALTVYTRKRFPMQYAHDPEQPGNCLQQPGGGGGQGGKLP